MKTSLIFLIGILSAIAAPAQTNTVVFAQLLSPANAILMTNAEFRTFSGNKIFFKNDRGYQSFHASDLNTNVLNLIGTSANKLDSQQRALEAANERYKEQVAAWQIENAKQQQIIDQQKAAKVAQAEADRLQRIADAKERAENTVIIQQPRGAGLNGQQSVGAYSP